MRLKTFQNDLTSVLKLTLHLDIYLFFFLFHHEIVMRCQNLQEYSEELILHLLVDESHDTDDLQPHVV